MCTIVQEPNKILRSIALPVPIGTIITPAFQDTLKCMQQALHREPDGVAIAAPQIAEPLRVFIVAGFVFDLKKKNIGGTKSQDRVFINPEIIKRSKETKWIPGEGCLSVRWIYGTAKRHKEVTVRAHDEQGKLFTIPANGLLAQIFQHENDHLEGILFIDKAKDLFSGAKSSFAFFFKGSTKVRGPGQNIFAKMQN
jgi:peptide deformylase